MKIPIRIALGSVLVAVLVVAFNVVVNPYGIWPDLTGRRLERKTARVNSVRLVKAYDLARGCPDAIITGMSSVVWGIDPQTYPVAGKRLYNGGIVGSSAIEQYAYVRSFLEQCPRIRKLYIDVNFESFHTARINAPDFVYARLNRRVPTWQDLVFTTFSRSALRASAETLIYHLDESINTRVYDRGDGFHRVPESSPEVYKNNFLMYLQGVIKLDILIDEKQIAFFREMVRLARDRGLEVEVYFAPIHYWLHYIRRYNGTASLQDELKRRLAEIHPFWDFNRFSELNTEPFDRVDQFVDMIHYRPRLGTMVLRVINSQPPFSAPAGFGVKITKESVESHLAAFHADIDRWERERPDEANLIRSRLTSK